MLRKSTFALAVLLMFALTLAVTAQEKAKEVVKPVLAITAVSPQAEKGVITAKDNFAIELVMDYNGPKDLTGGSFGVHFFSPDKSLKSVMHRDVDTTAKAYRDIELMNGWKQSFDALTMINLEKPFGYDGNLPDSVYFVFAGIKGYASGKGPQSMIRFNLMAEGSGKLCIDSVGKAADDMEWLFPEGYNVTFGGPYCWEIK